ncbi:hypothetical protein WA158_006448 [Blastocystis sp. Blastoise]
MNSNSAAYAYPPPQEQGNAQFQQQNNANMNENNNNEAHDNQELPKISVLNTILSLKIAGFIPTLLGYITIRMMKANSTLRKFIPGRRFYVFPLISLLYWIIGFPNVILASIVFYILSYLKNLSIPKSVFNSLKEFQKYVDMKLKRILGLSRIAQHENEDNYQYTVFLPEGCHVEDLQVQWSNIENNNKNQIFIYKKNNRQSGFDYYTSIELDFIVLPNNCHIEYQVTSQCPVLLVTIPKPKVNISTIPVTSLPSGIPLSSSSSTGNCCQNPVVPGIYDHCIPFVNNPSCIPSMYQQPFSNTQNICKEDQKNIFPEHNN